MSMTHDEMIAVIQASRDGKQIQKRTTDIGIALGKLVADQSDEALSVIAPVRRYTESELREWRDVTGRNFNFRFAEYRIKPEPPKPREWWVYMHGPELSTAHPEPFMSRELAELGKCANCTELILLREVLPNEEGK